MGFQEAIQSVFQKYGTFSGRARRSEYWYFVLFTMIINTIFGALTGFTDGSALGTIVAGLSGLVSLVLFIPGLAVAWRRLHDTGRSGGWYFIILVPLVGAILLLVWMCTDSQPGDNMYGPNPKGIGGPGGYGGQYQ